MRESLGFAIGAGTLAALNPCGFAMLPAYLTLFVVGNRNAPSLVAAVLRAVIATAAMTGGFLAVFVTFGLLLSPIASTVQRWLPIATILIGAAMATLGVLMFSGRAVRVRIPAVRARFDPATGVGSMALYGAAYAIASVGCTIGPFLAVTGTTFREGNFAGGIAAYAAYAAGMGLVVGVLAISIALAQHSVARVLRSVAPFLGRAGGALLVVVGLYVVWYGVYELRFAAGGSLDDPIVDAAGRIQQWLSDIAHAVGPGVLALMVLSLIGGVVITVSLRRHRSARDAQPPSPPATDAPAVVP